MKAIFVLVLTTFIEIHCFTQSGLYSFDEAHADQDLPFHLFPGHEETFINPEFFTGQERWSRDFTVPGIIGYIYVTATDGSNLYVGGNFHTAGGIVANNIVKWDGHSWSSLGEGPENGVGGDIPTVLALAWSDGKLFVGGQFSRAGSREVNGLAWWDGSSWNALGGDTANGVRRIMVYGNDTIVGSGLPYSLFAQNNKIYVGGDFQLAGENPTNGFGIWDIDAGNWETFNDNFRSIMTGGFTTVFAVAAYGNDAYIGGNFSFMADSLPAKNIARWDGNRWSSLGASEGAVFDIRTDPDGLVYATGFFLPDETTGACGIGIWDGEAWTPLPGPEGFRSSVNLLQIHNNMIYAAGSFESEEMTPDPSLARWDGSSWQILPGLGISGNEFLPGGITGMEMVKERFFAAGNFTRSGENYAVNIAEWVNDSSKWRLLDDGSANKGIHDGYIQTLGVHGDTVYAGGSFSVAGGTYARNIARWTGEGWEPLGKGSDNGIKGSVYTLLVDGEEVYAGGYFGMAGSQAAFHIARWDGNNWNPVGIGVGGVSGAYVSALAKVGNYLYAGGYFSVVGDEENYALPANSVARFNLETSRWETMGRGLEYVYGIPGRVNDMEVSGDKIYIGGEFQSADDNFFQNFVVLDNNKWSGIDGNKDIGVEGQVRIVRLIGGEIYIGGILRYGQDESVGLLRWEGKKWIGVGERLTAGERDVAVNDIIALDSGFIAGGFFVRAGENEVNNIAYFDGTEWNHLGGGVSPGITAMAMADDKLFIAGPREIFTGNGANIGFTYFDLGNGVVTGEDRVPAGNRSIGFYPNPFNAKATIEFTVPSSGRIQVTVLDINGRIIRSLVDEYKPAGMYKVEFDGNDLPGGAFLLRMIRDSHVETSKIIRIR